MAENYIKTAKLFSYTGSLTGTVQNISCATFLHGIYQATNIGIAANAQVDSACFYVTPGRNINFNTPLPFNCFSGSISFLLLYS